MELEEDADIYQNMTNKNFRVINPVVYEKTASGEEAHDIFWRLMKERILFLGEVVETNTANTLVSQLLWLNKQSETKPISLYINCLGGDQTAMCAIYDIMQYIEAPVHTFVLGMGYSAAAVLLAAGDKGNRYSLPNSEIMIHEPWVGNTEGRVTDLELQTKWISTTKKRIISILARHTGNTYQKVEEDCYKDSYMYPEAALEYGIIDNIIKPTKTIPALLDAKSKKQKK